MPMDSTRRGMSCCSARATCTGTAGWVLARAAALLRLQPRRETEGARHECQERQAGNKGG
ncbi:MAG: hypothetical protein WDM96_11630 [Lacunisphaera sp.]